MKDEKDKTKPYKYDSSNDEGMTLEELHQRDLRNTATPVHQPVIQSCDVESPQDDPDTPYYDESTGEHYVPDENGDGVPDSLERPYVDNDGDIPEIGPEPDYRAQAQAAADESAAAYARDHGSDQE